MAKTKLIVYYGPMASVFSEVQGNTLRFMKDQPTLIDEKLADVLLARQPNIFKLSGRQPEPTPEPEPEKPADSGRRRGR